MASGLAREARIPEADSVFGTGEAEMESPDLMSICENVQPRDVATCN